MNAAEPSAARQPVDARFPDVAYVPLRHREQTGFVRVICGDVALAWPKPGELERIAEWLRRDALRQPLGFPLAPTLHQVQRGYLPDLTGGFEPVEFLVIHLRGVSSALPFGFLVIYERRGLGRPHLELDLVVAEAHLSSVPRIRRIRLAVLAVLFAVRGAETVSWVRRHRPSVETTVDRERYRRSLERRAEAGHDLPEVVLEGREGRSW